MKRVSRTWNRFGNHLKMLIDPLTLRYKASLASILPSVVCPLPLCTGHRSPFTRSVRGPQTAPTGKSSREATNTADRLPSEAHQPRRRVYRLPPALRSGTSRGGGSTVYRLPSEAAPAAEEGPPSTACPPKRHQPRRRVHRLSSYHTSRSPPPLHPPPPTDLGRASQYAGRTPRFWGRPHPTPIP